MTRELESRKDLVNENVTRHDGSRDAIPTPCGRGSGCVSEASYNHRGGVNVSIDSQNPSPQPSPARGEGACPNNSGTSQSLIKVKNLTSYRLNDLTTSKKVAFTLAEILVTLAVIGIVAAMTIPNLVQSYNEKVTVTKVKKMYSVLSNAYEMYKIENGGTNFFDYTQEGAEQAATIFKPYLKIAKDCGTEDLSCLADTNYKFKSGRSTNNYNNDTRYYKLVLNDGSVLIFRGGQDEQYNFEIIFDVNGKSSPNQWGYDTFEFDENNGKIVPCGFLTDWTQACPIDETGYDCTAWIISKGNMDYLKN